MNSRILNRAGQLPADGWYNVEAKGEHVNHAAQVVQVIDDKAVNAILNRFSAEAQKAGDNWAGKPLDRDHLSDSMENSTEAYGWGMQLRASDNGYDAKIDWTAIGQPLVEVKDGRPPAYKFFSTGYLPGECEKIGTRKVGGKTYDVVRPLRLDSLSLTNDPNNKGQRPISNRNGNSADADENKTVPMNELMKLLGLAADASEASAVAAVQKIQNRASSLETENETLKTENKALLEAAVEQDLERYKGVIKNRDSMKKKLIANRAATIEILEELQLEQGDKAETKARITNRETARPPAGDRAQPGEPDEKKRADKIRNRANELKGQNPSRPFDACWQQAQQEEYAPAN